MQSGPVPQHDREPVGLSRDNDSGKEIGQRGAMAKGLAVCGWQIARLIAAHVQMSRCQKEESTEYLSN